MTVTVSDGNFSTDTITVTINVTDANDAPIFTDGESTSRSVAENTATGNNIGSVVAATDADNDTLTYSLMARMRHRSVLLAHRGSYKPAQR